MTLQEILPAVRQLPPSEKIELRRLLDEEAEAWQEITPVADTPPAIAKFESLYFLEGKPTIGPDDFPFSDGTVYEVYSPYDCSGLEFLVEALKKVEAEDKP